MYRVLGGHTYNEDSQPFIGKTITLNSEGYFLFLFFKTHYVHVGPSGPMVRRPPDGDGFKETGQLIA